MKKIEEYQTSHSSIHRVLKQIKWRTSDSRSHFLASLHNKNIQKSRLFLLLVLVKIFECKILNGQDLALPWILIIQAQPIHILLTTFSQKSCLHCIQQLKFRFEQQKNFVLYKKFKLSKYIQSIPWN